MLTAHDEGIPDAVSRSAQYRQRKSDTSAMTPFGPQVQDMVLPLTAGGTVTIAVQHPVAMLWHCCRSSPGFASFLRGALDANPPHAAPWRVALYTDEVGVSPPKVDARKTECV